MLAQPPSVTTQGFAATLEVMHDTSAVQVDVYLLGIAEGLAPRAILFSLVRLPQEKVGATFIDAVFQEVARECVRRFHFPPEWAGQIQRFLQRRSIFTYSSAKDFNNTVALSEVFCRATVARGQYSNLVWDLCTGREICIGAIRSRARVYAETIGSPADVVLSTRFVRQLYLEGEDPAEALSDLIRELTFVRDGGHELVCIGIQKNGFFLEYEASVQRWLRATARQSRGPEADGALARVLIHSLDMTSSVDDLQRQIHVLRSQLDDQ
jgi:hypothetical protein